MKKWIFRIFLVLGLLLTAGLIGGYFYGRAHLHEIPPLVKSQLAARGIQLAYQSAEIAPAGLKITLKELSVSGSPLPYLVRATSASIQIGLAAWPPVLVSVSAEAPTIEKNPAYQEAPAKPPAPAEAPPAAVGYALALAQFEAAVRNAEMTEFGVHGLTASVRIKGLGLGPNGVEKASLRHDVQIAKLDQAPWLPGLRWSGPSSLEYPIARTGDHTLVVGPFVLEASGGYDLKSQKWRAELSIPQTNLSAGSSILSAAASDYIRSVSGEIALKATAQGMGGDPQSINANGSFRAKGLKMTVAHPSLNGTISTNIESQFSKAALVSLHAIADIDLTKAEVVHADAFKKPSNIPLTLSFTVDGKDGAFTLSRGDAKFHNLAVALGGTMQVGAAPTSAMSANLTARISPTDLSGWEQFFPKYSKVKTQGSLQGDLAFNGPLKQWQNARFELALLAKGVRVPLLKEWIPSKDLSIEGVTSVNSDTKVVYAQGALKTLSSTTQIDLKDSNVSYGVMFQKPQGVAMSADVALVSTANRADIKRGDLALGSIRGSLKGSVDNFASPSANLRLETGQISVKELTTLAPAARLKTVTGLGGAVTLKASVTGPLTSPTKGAGPMVRGESTLNRITLQYEMESKKKIHIVNLSGPIGFTTDSVSGKKIQISLPNTEAVADFSISSFTKPDITFSLNASKFALKDLYDAPAGSATKSAGMAPVPVAAAPIKPGTAPAAGGAKAQAAEDFRKNPYLRNSRMTGNFNIRQADLGWIKSDSISGKIAYDKLHLKLDPMQIRLYNGLITYVTEWDGRVEVPQTKMSMKVEKVDANQFLSSFSDKVSDVVFGQLNTDMRLAFQGLTADQITKTTRGDGTFNLAEGGIKTVRLSKQPLESLKKLPGLGASISKTDWDEKLNTIRGSFKIEEGKLRLSDLVMAGPQFDAVASDTTLDFNGNLESKVTWTPKEGLIPTNVAEALRDSSGKPSLPLLVRGPIRSPSVTLDQGVVEGRVKAFASRKLEEEKSKATQQLKTRVEEEVKKKLGDKLKGIFE